MKLEKKDNVVKLEMSKDSTRYRVFISYFEGEEDPYIVSIPREEYFSLQTWNLRNIEYKLRERGFSETDAANIQELVNLYMDGGQ